jgi:hypothetical protein
VLWFARYQSIYLLLHATVLRSKYQPGRKLVLCMKMPLVRTRSRRPRAQLEIWAQAAKSMPILFAGNSVPIIGVGILSGITSSLHASIAFACAIAVFAAVGLLIGAKYAPHS